MFEQPCNKEQNYYCLTVKEMDGRKAYAKEAIFLVAI